MLSTQLFTLDINAVISLTQIPGQGSDFMLRLTNKQVVSFMEYDWFVFNTL